jgi:hypothetical protein
MTHRSCVSLVGDFTPNLFHGHHVRRLIGLYVRWRSLSATTVKLTQGTSLGVMIVGVLVSSW